MFRRKSHIHFVGIGGIGMSGIAEVLLNLGHQVSGSDLRESDITKRLAGMGAVISKGHRESNITTADVVVISSAVTADNVEVQAAQRSFIPVIPRAEMLAELMRLKYSVAVAGSHGKTTTTSMVGTILGAAGWDPTMVIGGRLDSIGSNARLGQGDFLVAEADESDGSFLLLSPTFAVVTNIDLEHLDYYRDLDHIKETFLTFINRIPFYGSAVICLEDSNVQSLIPHVKKRHLTYGFTTQADIQAVDVEVTGWGSAFNIILKGKNLGRMAIKMPGRHNILNSLAAAGIALELDIPIDDIKQGLGQVTGIHRRFQQKGQARGVSVLDDYGHHPTEIKATLAALRACYPENRLVVVFQPHRYSRTKMLLDEFATAFNQADVLLLTDIYPAGEKPISGLSGRVLADRVRQHGHREVLYEEDRKKLSRTASDLIRSGDVLLTLGAGNIWQVGEELLDILNKSLATESE